MTNSILLSTKKILGLEENYTAFDVDVIMHINSILTILTDIGIGPPDGFAIVDANDTWDDFLDGDLRFNSVMTYVYLRVRILFDPPTTSYLLAAMKEQYQELECRLSMTREEKSWTNPNPLPLVEGL